MLRGFKRKGMASFTNPRVAFSFILVLLRVVFPLF